MSLDLSRLKNVRKGESKTVARCPACAEGGGDNKGEHLVIYADGQFACVVNQGLDGHKHRQRILALAGKRSEAHALEALFRVRRRQGGEGSTPNGTHGTGIINLRATENSDGNPYVSGNQPTAYTHGTCDYPSQASQNTTPQSAAQFPQAPAPTSPYWVYLMAHSQVVESPLSLVCVEALIKRGASIKIMAHDKSTNWQDPSVFGFKSPVPKSATTPMASCPSSCGLSTPLAPRT